MKNKIKYKNIFRIIPFVLTVILFTIADNNSFGQTTDTYTSSGTFTWTCPTGVTEVTVQVWGGGGAGGGSTRNLYCGGGGGGGGYSTGTVPVTAGTNYTVTVGSGGTGSTGNGTDGGNSSFLTITANGGGGGTGGYSGYAGEGGDGGTATGGTTSITGENGADETYYNGNYYGGDGGNGANGGAGGAGSINANGNPGIAPGGGGGGGERSSSNRSGGAGASGQVILTYCASPTSYKVALNEGFEGTFLPTGWTQYDCPGDGSSNIWTKGSYGGYTTPEGSNSAIIEFDASNIVNRALQTPVIDITNYTCANLSYYVFINGDWDEEMHVEITKDGGTNWINLASHSTSYGGWSPLQTISLDSYVGNSVSIRFRYYQPSDDNSSGIDGVLITGCAYPPLSITTNPTNQSICYNSSADFSVVATGPGALSYQWQYQGSNIVNGTPAGAVYSGATTPTLSVSGTIANATYSAYTCVVSSSNTSVTSSGADLTISSDVAPDAPTNLTKSDDMICSGTSVTLGATVPSGTSLEWYSGSCSGTLLTSPVSPLETTIYYAKAYDSGSGCRSACSTITVNVMDNVIFVEQPESQYGCAGESLTFSVIATGAGLTYQWQEDSGSGFGNITDAGVYSGATTMNLAISNVIGLGGNEYRCVVTGTCDSGNSATATLSEIPNGLSGTYTVGTTGDYTTLKAAFDDINSNGLSGDTYLEVISNITNNLEASLNQWVDCAGNSGYVVTIYPTGGTRTISGNIATSLVTLNGADKVTIDGRIDMTGTANSLVFSNTNTAGSTLRFINDACDNVIQYATFRGVYATDDLSGVVYFGTGTSTGNNNNLISYCDIRNGTTTPSNGIYSVSSENAKNTNNTIAYCNIFNFHWYDDLKFTSGIYIGPGNDKWAINNNSFYQTSSTTGARYAAINIFSENGNNYTVEDNYIGGSNKECGGTAWTSTTGANRNTIHGIRLTCSSSGVSIIENNTIANLNFTHIPISEMDDQLVGIYTNGRVDIIENTIGDDSNGSINLTTNYIATTGYDFHIGIWKYGDGNVIDNKIGSINLYGTTQNRVPFTGIQINGEINNDYIVSGNIIGSKSTSNSIQTTSATYPYLDFYGIYLGTDDDFRATITGNNIANITSSSSNSSSYCIGIGNNTTAGIQTITGNTIRDILTASTNNTYGRNPCFIGITNDNSTTDNLTVSNNSIYNITATGNTNIVLLGILGFNASGTNTYNANNIHSFNVINSTTSLIEGITLDSGDALVSNNMINLGSSITNNATIFGMRNSTTGTGNIYFNSIYIGGSVFTGSSSTYAYYDDGNGISNLLNNILYNVRTGGTKRHLAIVTFDLTNWSSNYNILYSADPFYIGAYPTYANFTNWKSGTSGDANSINSNPLFTSIGNLHLQVGSPAIGTAFSGTGITTDVDNETRASSPCIGADEIFTSIGTDVYGIYSPDGINGNIKDCQIISQGGAPGGTGYDVADPDNTFWPDVFIKDYQVITASNLACTNSEFTFTTADASPNWLFGNGSNPTSSTSSPSTSEYESTGYKDLIESFKVYRDFNNLTMIAPDAGTILGAPSGAGCPTTYNYTSSVAGSAGFLYEWNCTAPSGCSVSINNPTAASTDITFVNQTGVNQIFLVTLDIETECCGALKQVRRYITIFPGPTMPEITENPYNTCTGGEQEVSVNNPDPTYSFQWFDAITGGTQLGSGTSFTFTTMPSGTNYYYVQSTNSFGCSSQRTQIEIEGEDADPPSVDDATTCGTNNVTLYINSPSAGYTYNWYISSCGGTPLQSSTGTNFTYNVTATTNFYVAAIPPGCAMSTCATPTITVLTPTDPILWEGDDATNPSDWFVAENWQNGCIPTCATNVSIPNLANDPDIKFDPTQVAEAKNINLQSGAELSFSVNKAVLQICGDFTHAGILTTNNLGTIEFTGSDAQKYIYSSGTGEFNNVRINNSNANPTLTIEGGDMIISPNGNLTFVNGTLVTGSNNLIIKNTASGGISGHNADRYVVGNLRRYITSTVSDYAFPVGEASRYALMDFTNNSLTGITYLDAKFMSSFTNTGILDPAKAFDGIIRYDYIASEGIWQLDPNTAPTGGSYDIALWHDDGGTGTFANLIDNQFAPVKRPSTSTAAEDWTALGGTHIPTLVADGYCERTDWTSFSQYAVAYKEIPLPVELLYFDAYYNGKNVDLDWSTATEINNDFFLVQKSSDATNFDQIGKVFSKAPNGNSNTQLFYSLNDNNINSGTYYYRLKQYDFDGAYQYSHIVTIIIGEKSVFAITPNPAKESVEINYYCINEANPIVKIYDSRGRIVHIDKLHCTKGQNKSSINISHLSPGLYTITLITDYSTEQVKLIKQ